MEFTKDTSCRSQLSYKIEKKKHCEVTYINSKRNTKEHTEEAPKDLSSDSVYLLFVSFCRFHDNFGLIRGKCASHSFPVYL